MSFSTVAGVRQSQANEREPQQNFCAKNKLLSLAFLITAIGAAVTYKADWDNRSPECLNWNEMLANESDALQSAYVEQATSLVVFNDRADEYAEARDELAGDVPLTEKYYTSLHHYWDAQIKAHEKAKKCDEVRKRMADLEANRPSIFCQRVKKFR